MNGSNDNTAAVDLNRLAHLGGDWYAAVCVDPDGEESLWLVAPTPGDVHGCACADCAPHDQGGRFTAATVNTTGHGTTV